MPWFDWVEWVIGIITAVTVAFAVVQLVSHSRQMHRDFEALYVARYWALMDRRSRRFAVTGRPGVKDAPVVHAYFQLCEDEIDLRRVGRITTSTWEQWGPWMLEQCAQPGYARLLESSEEWRYPGLRDAINQGPAHDPLPRRRIRRWWQGL